MKKLAFLFSALFLSTFLWSTSLVPFSGKLSINGVNFDGSAEFAFSLYDSKGVTHWRNGSKKDFTISVPVVNGRYTILLGGQGMNPLPSDLFLDYDELYLKVRFAYEDGKGLRHLAPDQQITATPRALVAEVAKVARLAESAKIADSVKEGGIAASQIKNNTITTTQLNEQILKYLKPEITSSPTLPTQRKNIYTGQNLTLSGTAEGKYLTYQWNRNGKPIEGATSRNLNISNLKAQKYNGLYSLTVSNDFGSVTSDSLSLDVNVTRLYHSVPSASNMEMIWVEPGTFTMGSPISEAGRGSDETQHEVTLANGFYLGKYEVTQEQYEKVMTGNSEGLNANPSHSHWKKNDHRPVEQVSWNDIQIFISRLNNIEQTAGRLPNGWKYVLPTEAQWEYACRAGTTTLYSWGNDINSSMAHYNKGATTKVGQYPANQWGFFDMHGNVFEYVHDWKGTYPTGHQNNPEGPAGPPTWGTVKVLRGGSWNSVDPANLRSAKRGTSSIGKRLYIYGFRVAFQLMPADLSKPEIIIAGNSTLSHSQGLPFVDPGFGAHDARDGNLTTAVKINGTVDVNKTGTYKLTYSVSDAAGNQATVERTVTVVSNDLTFVAEISAYHSNKSFFETRNLKPFYETTITADNNSSAVNFDSWWRDESESPNRPWSETNKADLDGTMIQNFPSMTSFSIEKFSDVNVKETFNASIEWYNWYHMPKLFKFSQEIFTDAFKQKFPEGTKVRITYTAN